MTRHPSVDALALILKNTQNSAVLASVKGGVGRTTVPRWLNGSQVPSVVALDQVLRAYGYQLVVVPTGVSD